MRDRVDIPNRGPKKKEKMLGSAEGEKYKRKSQPQKKDNKIDHMSLNVDVAALQGTCPC